MKKIFIKSLIVFSALFFVSCASTNPINDFFGIQMNPDEEQNFKIVKYSEKNGVTYQSSRDMDASISAWAEIGAEDVRIKIVNNSKQSIPMNYNLDQYIIITNAKQYVLEKGKREKYFSHTSIEPNSDVELILKLPNDYVTNFNQQFEVSDGTELTKRVIQDYSKVGNQENVNKENIRYILIKLNRRVLLLKKVPKVDI